MYKLARGLGRGGWGTMASCGRWLVATYGGGAIGLATSKEANQLIPREDDEFIGFNWYIYIYMYV